MTTSDHQRFDTLYQRHLQALRLQGMADSTRDVYARAVRRLRDFHGVCPDQLTVEQVQDYFAVLVETHSWSTVKVDRNPNAARAYNSSGATYSNASGIGCLLFDHLKSPLYLMSSPATR